MANKPEATPRNRLLDILSFGRPYGTKAEKRWLRENLDTIPGMEQDAAGNRWLRIVGPGDNILWSCHTDTVHPKNRGGRQKIFAKLDPKDRREIIATAGYCLGADDGVGVWLLKEMIAHQKPGLYVFHRGEEVGGVGSQFIAHHNPGLLSGINIAIALDRRGTGDVITHQVYRTASYDFALALANVLNQQGLSYQPDDTGSFTDTANYSDLIPECTNISVGYEGEHGKRETLDIDHALKLREALLYGDFTELRTSRNPAQDYDLAPARSNRYFSAIGRYGGEATLDPEVEAMAKLLRDYPRSISKLLINEWGITHDELQDELDKAWAHGLMP